MFLNYDILTRALSYATSTEDLARTTRTCRTLRSSGVAVLLRRGIEIGKATNVSSFIMFLDAEQERRPLLLRKIRIDYRAHGADNKSGNIADILSRCLYIKTLSIRATLLDVDVRIGAALVRLEHIKELQVLRGCYSRSLVPFLSSMRSTCVIVDFAGCCTTTTDGDSGDGDEGEDDEDHLPPSNDPNLALLAFSSSLRNLNCIAYGQWPNMSPTTIQYPHVETLTISPSLDFQADLGSLVDVFPNLLHLTVTGRYPVGYGLEHDCRARHLLLPQWTQLAYLCGSVGNVYVFGLSCPVQRWDIAESDSYDHDHVEALSAIMKRMVIKRLQLKVTVRASTALENLFQCFERSLSLTLTHLALHFEVLPSLILEQISSPSEVFPTSLENLPAMMTRLAEAVHSLTRLRYLALDISFHTLDAARQNITWIRQMQELPSDSATVEQDPRIEGVAYVYKYVTKSANRRQIAIALATARSTLQYVFVRTNPILHDYYWLISREGGILTMTELDVQKAQKVMQDEGMHPMDFHVHYRFDV